MDALIILPQDATAMSSLCKVGHVAVGLVSLLHGSVGSETHLGIPPSSPRHKHAEIAIMLLASSAIPTGGRPTRS